MKYLLLFALLIMPILFISCLNYSEHDYDSNTGTFSIPWGEKEGKRNPEESY